ncbi:MAG TPA: MFS transporter [Actinotalea sp.]
MTTARRDLALLLGGAAVSTIGSSLSLLAVMVFLEPDGALWVASAMGAELVPMVLLAPLAGRLVDRLPNRQLLVGSLLLQAAALVVGALVGLRPGNGVVLLAAVAMLGVGGAVANPTIAALLPHLTGEEHATKAYGWYSAITQAGFLVGFAVSGVLVELTSVGTALLADAASFVVMGAAVLALRTQRIPEPHPEGAEQSAWIGFARIRQDQLLLVGVLGLAAAVLATVIVNVAEVFFVVHDIGAGPAAYGVVTAFWPAAGILGGWWAGRLVGEHSLFRALAAASVVMGVALALAGAVVSLVGVAVAWVIGGAAAAVQRVTINALIRSRTDDAERGRVFAAVGAVFRGGDLLGLALGAGVVGLIGARSSLLLSGGLTLTVGVVTWVLGRSRVAGHASPAPAVMADSATPMD